MMPNAMAGIPRRDLGQVVANLDAHRDTILHAMDMLLLGEVIAAKPFWPKPGTVA